MGTSSVSMVHFPVRYVKLPEGTDGYDSVNSHNSSLPFRCSYPPNWIGSQVDGWSTSTLSLYMSISGWLMMLIMLIKA